MSASYYQRKGSRATYIETVSIENYKCFEQLGPIELGQGFNVIVGQNNAGKTALIEALSIQENNIISGNKLHRSMRTSPILGALTRSNSTITLAIHFDADEVEQILLEKSVQGIHIPVLSGDQNQGMEVFLETLKNSDTFSMTIDNGQMSGCLNSLAHLQSLPGVTSTTLIADHESHAIRVPKQGEAQSSAGYESLLMSGILDRIYAFKAERFNISECPIGPSTALQTNASNLAEVLHNLQNNPRRFERFNQYVREIFPEVGLVNAPISSDGKQIRALVWLVDIANTERDDLAISLADSGTGLGQVMAMLYIVTTSDHPRIIMIDEPQSFLHPGAVRKLIDILRLGDHQKHQFIVTTHSPEVVTASDPCVILLLRKQKAQTEITKVNANQTQDLRNVLSEVGTRLSDVFGADHILWVEGRTEERCFPLIVEKILKQRLLGTKILGVLNTGDFEAGNNNIERIARIYGRLSQGGSLLPSAIGFFFDRETKTKTQRDDISRIIQQAGSQIRFTGRRMYENYLLNPHAIAAVMSAIPDFRPTNPIIAEAEVATWIDEHKLTFYDTPPKAGEDWRETVHGANLLKSCFKELSDGRIPYEKVEYGEQLTEWIIGHSPDDLSAIKNTLYLLLFGGPES
jgi:predicted ATPase